MIDALAKERHFVDHIAPVWGALGDARGIFFVTTDEAGQRASELGISAAIGLPPGGPILAASIGDLQAAVKLGRRGALMEHGCGLSYGGGSYSARVSPSYAGGVNRDAELFLHPGEHPAARDRAKYPEARVEVVGSPRLDLLPAREGSSAKPVVAVSFHWDCRVTDETRSTFLYYRSHLERLKADFEVIGHGHPRIFDRLAIWYEKHGIEPVRDFNDVCKKADLYAVDNSSTLYEFASTGRPVLVLNAPFYRKHVSHGLRFWDAATVGVQCDAYYELEKSARLAMSHPAPLRESALDLVYAYRTGAAERAASVLRSWA